MKEQRNESTLGNLQNACHGEGGAVIRFLDVLDDNVLAIISTMEFVNDGCKRFGTVGTKMGSQIGIRRSGPWEDNRSDALFQDFTVAIH